MTVKKLQPHHHAWLSCHPGRSEEWLREIFKDGFDIHHFDGDHSNNTPLNLVLIESVDHMRLHGFKLPNGITGWRRRMQDKSSKAKVERAREIVALEADDDAVTYIAAPIPAELDEMSVRAYMSRNP